MNDEDRPSVTVIAVIDEKSLPTVIANIKQLHWLIIIIILNKLFGKNIIVL